MVTAFSSRTVAEWARQPVAVSLIEQAMVDVVGPEELPPIVDVRAAKRLPELAVLSAFARTGESDVLLAAQAAYGCQDGL